LPSPPAKRGTGWSAASVSPGSVQGLLLTADPGPCGKFRVDHFRIEEVGKPFKRRFAFKSAEQAISARRGRGANPALVCDPRNRGTGPRAFPPDVAGLRSSRGDTGLDVVNSLVSARIGSAESGFSDTIESEASLSPRLRGGGLERSWSGGGRILLEVLK